MPRLAERCIVWISGRKTSAVLSSLVVAALAAVILAFFRFAAPVTLFDVPLHASQTSEIERALTLWAEPYQADERGTQIFVRRMRRKDVLLRLALAGLPHRYVATTADILDAAVSPLTPESVIDDRRRSGIEGDLVAGLRRMDGVDDALVVISPAPSDPLTADGRHVAPSASVQILMQSGARLSPAALDGVKRFVAAGYPGLAPSGVAVVDAGGSLQKAADAADHSAARERRTENAVQSALDAALGPGVAIVRVSVRDTGAVQATESTKVVPHGLLDADVGREHGSERGRAFEKERTNRHYAYDTVVERRSSSADAVARMSVAVFLDAARVKGSATANIADLARAAAGADLRSGDEVVVKTLPFERRAESEREPIAPHPAIAQALLPAAVIVTILALGLALWRRAPVAVRAPDADDRTATALLASLDRELPRTAAYVLAGLPQRLRDRVLRSYDTDSRARIEMHMSTYGRN
ncbi:MAG: hypothetical protein GIX02_02205 [Candidatus Eremiobacteraeota bacterium]|nr:hypothetical protein [Candidatus Eremiobacteraeota bacterium]